MYAGLTVHLQWLTLFCHGSSGFSFIEDWTNSEPQSSCNWNYLDIYTAHGFHGFLFQTEAKSKLGLAGWTLTISRRRSSSLSTSLAWSRPFFRSLISQFFSRCYEEGVKKSAEHLLMLVCVCACICASTWVLFLVCVCVYVCVCFFSLLWRACCVIIVWVECFLLFLWHRGLSLWQEH